MRSIGQLPHFVSNDSDELIKLINLFSGVGEARSAMDALMRARLTNW